VTIALLSCAVLIAACVDTLVAPTSRRAVSGSIVAGVGRTSGQQYGPMPIPIGDPTNPNGQVVVATFPRDRWVLVRIRVDGLINPEALGNWPVPHAVGPQGIATLTQKF
jgi:hypothetical protein